MISKANLGQQLALGGGGRVDALTAQHPTAHSWVQVRLPLKLGLGTRGTGVSLWAPPPTPVFFFPRK